MPRFSKYNDAVRYDLRWKSQTFTQKAFNDLLLLKNVAEFKL